MSNVDPATHVAMMILSIIRSRPVTGAWLFSLALFFGGCSESPTSAGNGEGSTPVPTTGRIVFWTNNSAVGAINVKVAGQSGTISSAFSAAPSCGQTGAYTVTLSPATHSFTATAQSGVSWSGNVNATAGSCSRMQLEYTGTPPTTPPPTPPSPGSGSFTTPNTMFVVDQGTLSSQGASWSKSFTLGSTRTLVFHFVSEFTSDAAIFAPSQLSAFNSGGSISAFSLFSGRFGTQSVTLPAGQYYVGVRNRSSTANSWRFELDYDIALSAEKGHTFSFVDIYVSGTQSVAANGGWLTQPFTIQTGFRYLIDGANVGLETYTIPASELSKFTSNSSFQYYADYSGTSGAYPGLWELNLPAGNYYVVFRNRSTRAKPVTYMMERWRINP